MPGHAINNNNILTYKRISILGIKNFYLSLLINLSYFGTITNHLLHSTYIAIFTLIIAG